MLSVPRPACPPSAVRGRRGRLLSAATLGVAGERGGAGPASGGGGDARGPALDGGDGRDMGP